MRRQVKAEPPVKGGRGAKPNTLGVSKPPLKLKLGHKDIPRSQPVSADGVLDMDELEKKRKEFTEQLKTCETQIYNLEKQFFEVANPQGNALKGYEGLLSTTSTSAKRPQFRTEDRIFSGSSTTGSTP